MTIIIASTGFGCWTSYRPVMIYAHMQATDYETYPYKETGTNVPPPLDLAAGPLGRPPWVHNHVVCPYMVI